MKNKYSVEDVKEAVKKSKSLANVLRLIGLKAKGGNYSTINKFISDNGIDITHFTGKIHNVGEDYKRINQIIPINLFLVDGLKVSSSGLRIRLIKEGIKQHCCENCNLTEWLGNKILLELHHIDGNHFNNELSNIQLLCPNCHANTPNYRGNNMGVSIIPKTLREMYPELFVKKEKIDKIVREVKENFCQCGNKIKNSSKTCIECKYITARKVERPNLDILLNEIKDLGYTGTGRKYGVSDNTIRKWVKKIQ